MELARLARVSLARLGKGPASVSLAALSRAVPCVCIRPARRVRDAAPFTPFHGRGSHVVRAVARDA